MTALLERPDPEKRRRLTATVLEDGSLPLSVLGESVVGVGLTADLAIRLGRPVGVIVRNSGLDLRIAGLRLLVGGAKTEYPLTVFVDREGEVRQFTFETERSLHERLGEVAPGAAELFILWADKRWGPRLREPSARFERLWSEQAVSLQLEALRDTRDLAEWRRLAERFGSVERGSAVRLAAENLSVVGAHADLWTRGTSPVGLLAVNSSDTPLAPSVKLSGRSADEASPVSVFLDDGRETREYVLASRGSTRLALPEVSPRSKGLFLLWTDSSWSPGEGDSRTLGVRLVPSKRVRKR